MQTLLGGWRSEDRVLEVIQAAAQDGSPLLPALLEFAASAILDPLKLKLAVVEVGGEPEDRARHALLAAPARLEAAVEFVELRRVRSKLETVRSIAEADPLDPTGVELARQQLDGLP